jgi:hypothetical protein
VLSIQVKNDFKGRSLARGRGRAKAQLTKGAVEGHAGSHTSKKGRDKWMTVLAVGLLSLAGSASVYAQTTAPSTYKHIAIDGSLDDWTGVPLAYTATAGPTNAIQYENVYVANDENNLYIRFTLYSPRANAFANSYDNLFIDADDSSATGYPVGGIGSDMLVQWGGGYQEKNGGSRVQQTAWISSWPFHVGRLMRPTAALFSPMTRLRSCSKGMIPATLASSSCRPAA